MREGIMEKPLSFKNRLQSRFQAGLLIDEPMSRHTSLGVGGPCDAFVRVKDAKDLRDALEIAAEAGMPWYMAGRGTNILVLDKGLKGLVLFLDGDFTRVRVVEEDASRVLVRAGAGAGLQGMCRFAAQKGFSGMNFAAGIPASLGGALWMNAGTEKGNMASITESVMVFAQDGREKRIQSEQLGWSYRNLKLPGQAGENREKSILTEAVLALEKGDPSALQKERDRLLTIRKAKQPLDKKSAGSFFKNPETGFSAGALIDASGLKGMRVGGAMVSPMHANFIVNHDRATARDILLLSEMVRDKVFKDTGIRLEPEVEILGA